jgi:hypothetical protein
MSASRVELKYCVDESEAAAVLNVARLFLEADRGMTRPQRITSLYLDSPALTFLGWHEAGRPHRFKLRIRCYGAAPSTLVYAEVKRKASGRTYKCRAAIPASSVGPMLAAGEIPSPATPTDESALTAFCERQQAFAAEPQVLLRYERESLRGGDADRALGVTVDRNVEYQRCHAPAFDAHPQAWSALALPTRRGMGAPMAEDRSPASAILELKYGDRPPAWMSGLMARLEPRRLALSKYRSAMRAVLATEGARA